MVNLATALLGPLVGPECRRALARGWLLVVRTLAAIAILGAALITVWVWWMYQNSNRWYLPLVELRTGLAVVEGMMITVVLVLGPAVLAGSLAGERERGALGLLLTTRVSSREIVLGRLVGKLTQVGMIVLAGVPAVVLLASLSGMNGQVQLLLLTLPVAVGLGSGGISVLASAVSRRGRDALLGVYLIDVLFLLSPLASFLGVSFSAFDWLGTLNPYTGLSDLIWGEKAEATLVSMGLWLAMGVVGTTLAAWRLRPSALIPGIGERLLGLGKRRGQIPPVDEHRPMLWKELYIERAAAMGGAGWWIGALLALGLGGGSVAFAAIIAFGDRLGASTAWIDWAKSGLTITVGESAMFVSWLIQWAIGLRAAVAISSERERGTWDAILTSPLQGREIVRAKVWGSLHALRWLFAAILLAWTVAVACAALPNEQYARWVIGTIVLSAFMAAVGVRTSLAVSTATRAMSLTIGIWLGAKVAANVLASIINVALLLLVWFVSWMIAAEEATLTPAWLGTFLSWSWPICLNGLFVVATALLMADTRFRFDRIAGRITEGRFEKAVDELVHGRPMAPIPKSLIVEVGDTV
jgi:ABC-type transport system involved in multi-copper enzyme maturation permease subunit